MKSRKLSVKRRTFRKEQKCGPENYIQQDESLWRASHHPEHCSAVRHAQGLFLASARSWILCNKCMYIYVYVHTYTSIFITFAVLLIDWSLTSISCFLEWWLPPPGPTWLKPPFESFHIVIMTYVCRQSSIHKALKLLYKVHKAQKLFTCNYQHRIHLKPQQEVHAGGWVPELTTAYRPCNYHTWHYTNTQQ